MLYCLSHETNVFIVLQNARAMGRIVSDWLEWLVGGKADSDEFCLDYKCKSKTVRFRQRVSRILKRRYASHIPVWDRLIPPSEERWANERHAFLSVLLLHFRIQAATVNKTNTKRKWPFSFKQFLLIAWRWHRMQQAQSYTYRFK